MHFSLKIENIPKYIFEKGNDTKTINISIYSTSQLQYTKQTVKNISKVFLWLTRPL